MKKLILILMVGSLFAQNLPPQSDIEKMSPSEKLILYNMNEKNPTTGIIYSLLLPSYGHAYAGHWRRGLLFASVEVGLMIFGLDNLKKGYETEANFGLIGATAINIWEIVDANKLITKYNKRLYKSIFGQEPTSIGFKLQPTYQGANLTMGYAFN